MPEQTWNISINDNDDLTIWIQGPPMDDLTYRQVLALYHALGDFMLGKA